MNTYKILTTEIQKYLIYSYVLTYTTIVYRIR